MTCQASSSAVRCRCKSRSAQKLTEGHPGDQQAFDATIPVTSSILAPSSDAMICVLFSTS